MTVVIGEVRDHTGSPVPGVFVNARPASGRRFSVTPTTHTDLSGRWWFDLAPGQWHVRETGHQHYDVLVGEHPIDVSDQYTPRPVSAPDPEPDDIARLLARRQFTPRDERDANPLSSEGRPLVESSIKPEKIGSDPGRFGESLRKNLEPAVDPERLREEIMRLLSRRTETE